MTNEATPSPPRGDEISSSDTMELLRRDPHISGMRLLSKIWTTEGARFNAARRLKAMSRWSLAAQAFLSGYVLLATTAPVFVPFGLTPRDQGLLNLVLVGMALFILILTLLEAANSYEVRAERLHDCAVELSKLKNELEILLNAGHLTAGTSLLEYQQRYDSILGRYSVNHEPVDDKFYRLGYPKDYPEIVKLNWLERLLIRSEYYSRPRALYVFLIVVPLGALLSFVW